MDSESFIESPPVVAQQHHVIPLWILSKVITLKVDELMYDEIDDLVLKWGTRFMDTQVGVIEGVELMLKILDDTMTKIKSVTIDTIVEKVND